MISMTLRRSAASVAVGALAATGLVAVSTTTASAVTTVTPKVEIARGYTWSTAGSTISFQARVSANGAVLSTSNNTLQLQRSIAGGPWTTLKTESVYSSTTFRVPATYTAQYRVYFPGNSDADYQYSSTVSPVATTAMKYKVKGFKKFRSAGKPGLRGKVSPKVAGKVLVQVKKGAKWRTVTKFRAKGGKWSFTFRAKTSQTLRMVFPGSKKNMKTVVGPLFYTVTRS